MLGAAAGIGAQARVPAMVLLRAPLGEQGSYIPTAINVAQTLGWTVFELLVIATAAAALSDELFGFEAQWAWTLVFGAFALALGLVGPIGFVRRYVRRIAVWAVPVALAYLIWWTLDGADLGALWDQPGEGGLLDVAGRRHRRRHHGLLDPARRGLHALLAFGPRRRSGEPGSATWSRTCCCSHSARSCCSRATSPTPAGLPAAVAAGGVVALLALLALTVGETDDAFANAYSAAVSLQNLFPELPIRLLVTVTTSIGVLGALTIELTSYQGFLLLLGSVFVPLFGVLLGHWLVSGRRYDEEDIFDAPAWRPGLVAAWGAGFALYQWLFPTGPSGWVEQVERFDPPEWGIGATVPSFVVSFALAAAITAVQRRFSPATVT